ncbi:hypothetical protein FLAG1_08210 [Fusarium langsethiae]|uniref:Uncharacterized protein n=1 Tax=Fusarium langsethiae TaxID=179993 RepID=A0A0N0DCZ2_FUSLA|nr:hypothetical protein FLAG1_08210 [Fusarium langsethiae]
MRRPAASLSTGCSAHEFGQVEAADISFLLLTLAPAAHILINSIISLTPNLKQCAPISRPKPATKDVQGLAMLHQPI